MLNILQLIGISILQFAFGAIWYGFVFGKIWGKIHKFDTLDKEMQKKLEKDVPFLYIVQFINTVLTTYFLYFLKNKISINEFQLVFVLWLGFILPTQVSSVIFSQTEKKWFIPQILILSFELLLRLLITFLIF